MTKAILPEHADKKLLTNPKEYRPRKGNELAKPKGIERKGNKFRVYLEYEGKRCHIGYYKTLEDAEEALEQAKREANIE